MPITGAIPLPETGMDAFLNELQRGQENKLRQAQMEEAQGKAAKSRMLANLIDKAMGGAGSGQGAGNVNNALLASDLLGLQSHVVDGNIVTPFGVQKIGESPQEKGQREVQQHVQEKQGEESIDEEKTLYEQAADLHGTLNDIRKIKEILKRRPSVTGPLAGRMGDVGFSTDKDLAAINLIGGTLQTKLAKLASQKGGIGAINWARGMKIDTRKPGKWNASVADEIEKRAREDYEKIVKRYKQQTGKELPSFDEEMQDQSQVQNTEMQPQYSTSASTQAEVPVQHPVAPSQALSISKGMQLPRFNSKEEFQTWFKKQPKVVQHAITLHLHTKGNK